ncbi:MAG: hypothetical protein JETCAE03_32080 [Ignavibacteriaceae bacterium]|nr:MAG: hypothetical protein JETCAE03_32080 [Ignavibacteriaceae bacterium]
MKLEKLPIHKFNYENSINYNRISHSEIIEECDYTKLKVKILGYQKSDAIGFHKPGINYVVLFEFEREEMWMHVSEAFFRLNKMEIA